MGISNKSHGKKSDKETQSPVLKLFRDMMQKEKHNPEKTNLLKNKAAEKKKKRHYHKSVESSSDRQDTPYKGNQELRNAEYDPTRSQSIPFQGGKRESWWFWGEPDTEKPASDDTCSCVSCALKKIINTDYACICCLVLLFTISVIVAFLLVYKSIPCLNDKSGSGKIDNDRPKRKIDGLSRLRWDHLGKKALGSKWDTGFSSYGVPHSMDSASSFHDLTTLVDSDSDLFKILDDGIIGEIQSSDRLREFYKKLIQIDAQIRNLKKNNDFSLTNMDNIEDKYKTSLDRAKRSLKILHKPLKLFHFRKNKKDRVNKNNKICNHKNKINNQNKNTEETNVQSAANKDSKLKNLNASRNKRFDNITEPEGYIIENKKVLIQYKPKHIHRKSKCSHVPKDSKSHENQLKHPFYQNTQRLDELLDKFLDKNFPEIMTDQFGLDMIFEKDKKCKHPKILVDVKESSTEKVFIKDDKALPKLKEELKSNNDFKNIHNDFTKTIKSETSTTVRNDVFADLELDVDKKREDTTTDIYGLLMSVSTMMYSGSNNFKRTTYPPLIDRVPNARRLLQTDADDDINEVMVDSSHEEVDKEDRNKRMDDPSLEDLHNKLKMNPVNILNPNWKGPMPLYPDELSSMIKQEPIIVNRVENSVHRYNSETIEEPIANKVESIEHRKDALESDVNIVNDVEIPVNSRDSPSKTDEFETDLNDMEYIEDYFRNKYDRLVELAQAYSDYGVLDGKKINEKKIDDKLKLEGPDHRIKLSLSGFKEGFKNSIFGRPKKGSPEAGTSSEGFRLEIQPTSASREDNPLEIYKALQKHIKVSNYKKPTTQSDLVGSDLDLIYRPRSEDLTTKKFGFDKNGLIFAVGKGKRTLKSIELDNNKSSEVSGEDDVIYTEQNIRNVFDSIHMKEKNEVGNSLTEDNNVNSSDKFISINKFTKNSTKNYTNYGKTNMKLAGDVSDNSDMSLSNFFMLLANWFSALDGVDFFNHSLVEPSSYSSPNNAKPNEHNNNKTEEMMYPAYDADMIENIGHRSRVLLSVEDINDTVTVDHKDDKEGMVVNGIVDLKITNVTNSLPVTKTVSEENKTKSIVKRDADNNLIFWNDLYDDEYGVLDHFENNIRDKHSVGNVDFMRRPNEWFREKVSRIANGFHKRAKSFRKEHKGGDAVKSGKEKYDKEEVKIKSKSKNADYKRNSRDVEDNGAKKTNFAELTASMKKICRNAARDIAQANKVDVREVSKEGQAASTLMQQLVRLMGDLVDYQVKQRTCRKLPSDLQNFLEWLTSSSPDTESSKHSSGYKTDEYPEMDFGKTNDKSEDHTLNMASSSEREDRPDSRSDCLGTLQSLQALMRQYEDLADDDKSKMTGVKEYLENQMQYIQKRMTSIYDYNLYNIDALRFRRDITSESPKNKHKRRKRRFKQIIKNFVKKIGRKYHNTNDKTIRNYTNNDSIKNLNDSNKEVISTIKEKRNLRDVYYKAVADAKKLTTVKNHV